MIQQITLSQIKPLFIQVANSNGYPKDLSTEPDDSRDKGYVFYEPTFATIYNSGKVAACVLQLNDQGVNIVSTKKSDVFAKELQEAIGKQYPNMEINLEIGALCDCSGGEKC